MKILVTGGSGFVGQALARTLRARGHEVWTLDLQHSSAPTHLRADLRSFRTLEQILEAQQFALVYHLAAEAGRWNGEDHYEALWSTNVVGTKHLIRLQERLRFRLVFMSSSEVYGDYAGVMREAVTDEVPIRLLNDYAMTKWVGEQQVMNSAEMFGTESVRIRMFNLYGPGEPYGPNRGVTIRFIWHALHGIPYTVYRHHHRTSTYIDDAVNTLANLTERFRPGAVYNIGGEEYHDIETLSRHILRLTGRDEGLVTYADGEAFTTRDKRVDLTLAREELGHQATMTLEKGLAETVAWARRAWLESLP